MRSLIEYNRENAQALGGKAYGLWLATGFGWEIPDTSVLEAHELFSIQNAARFRNGLWAVRSCDPNEDSDTASFAGQHTSIMPVAYQDLPAAIAAVRTPGLQAAAYAGALAVEFSPRLNVLIQPYLEFEETGVYFSQDPEGANGMTLLETVAGPLAPLVSGTVNPKTTQTWPLNTPTTLLQRRLTGLTRYLHPALGSPLDIEIGILPRFTVLQVRPLTAALKGSMTAKLALGTGQVTGRVVRRPGHAPILPDSILCTTMTDISMIEDMRKAAAIVTEVGSRTCHAAIVARELGLHVLIGCLLVGFLANGTRITVDFDNKCVTEVK